MTPEQPPEYVERPIPLWQKVSGAVVLLLTAGALLLWHERLPQDFWPPDASRVAPNLLASVIQWALVLIAAALLWPPTRRRLHRALTRHTAPLHRALAAAAAQRTRLHAEHLAAHAETQRQLRHVIAHHPDIPPLPDKEQT